MVREVQPMATEFRSRGAPLVTIRCDAGGEFHNQRFLDAATTANLTVEYISSE